MATHPRAHAAHRPRRALWVLLLVAVVLHSGLGARVHTLRVAECAAATAPHTADRVAELDSPCAPMPQPHHAPCGVRTHQQRDDEPRQAGVRQRCPAAVSHPGDLTWPGRACPRREASRPPVRRSGAGLLIDLCASRT